MIHPERIAEVMGGFAALGSEVRSVQDLEKTIAVGLPKIVLRRTVERVYLNAAEARDAIYRIVPQATFKRRTLLSQSEGERTERLARMIAAAEYVWDDAEDAREWLTRSHPELNGQTPLRTAESELGARRVEHVLDSLFYGLPA